MAKAATKTKPKAPTLKELDTAVEEAAAHLAELDKAVEEAAARLEKAEEKAAFQAKLDPKRILPPGADDPRRDMSPEEIDEELAERPEVEKEVRLARAAKRRAVRRRKAALEHLRECERAADYARTRPFVPKLDKALARVEELLRDAHPYDAASGAGVTSGLRVLVGGAQRQGIASRWRERMRGEGLLEG